MIGFVTYPGDEDLVDCTKVYVDVPGTKNAYDYQFDLRDTREIAWKLMEGVVKSSSLCVFGLDYYNLQKIFIYQTLTRVVRYAKIFDAVLEREKPKSAQIVNHLGFEPDLICSAFICVARKHKVKVKVIGHGRKMSLLRAARIYRNLQRRVMPRKITGELFYYHYGMHDFHNIERLVKGNTLVSGDGLSSNKVMDYCRASGIECVYAEAFAKLRFPSPVDSRSATISFNGIKLDHALGLLKEQLDGWRYLDAFLIMSGMLNMGECRAGVLSTDAMPFGRIACHVLEEKKRSKVVLAHGPLSDSIADAELFADKILVWSELEKTNMRGYGMDANRIVVVGTDSYANLRRRWPKKQTSGKTTLFAAKSPIMNDMNKILELIKSSSGDLVIKMHPSDRSISPQALSEVLDGVRVERETSFYGLLRESDLLITNSSCRTGLDAIAFNVPLIIWDAEQRLDMEIGSKIKYDDSMKAFVRVSGLENIKDAVSSTLGSKDMPRQQEKYFQKYYSGLDRKKYNKIIQSM